MRSLIIAGLASGLLLAGCGSTASTPAPVEAGSQTGEMAAASADCPLGPPAQGQFQVYSGMGNDGVVGSIYNDTMQTIDIGHRSSVDKPCALKPGERMAFSASSPYGEAFFAVRQGANVGALVTVSDPSVGYPSASVSGFSGRDGCGAEDSSPGLREGQEWRSSYLASGAVTIKRLSDDGAAARQWSGIDSWKVDDWARMDIRIERLGEGC